MRPLAVILVLLALPGPVAAQYTLSGSVYDRADREALPGATIQVEGTSQGTTANAYGFYSLHVAEPVIDLRVSFVGFAPLRRQVDLRQTNRLDVFLEVEVVETGDVVVTAERYALQEEVLSTRMGTVTLKPSELTALPMIGGEADLIKVAKLLPGVTAGTEGGTGMFVRGGTIDQNLVVLDDAVVYNIGHLFGFFSVFNTDAVKDVQVVKGGFPARYGGRLSSVIDVRMAEGSAERLKATGGVGLLTSRLTVDGPLLRNRASFMVAARRTYIDKVFGLFGADLPYYFYDLNGKLNVRLSKNDRLYLSTYYGNDVLALNEPAASDSTATDDGLDGDLDFGFTLGNFTTTLRWNHLYPGGKLFSNVTLHQTRFRYDIWGRFLDNELLIRSRVRDVGVKADWEYYRTPESTVYFGAQAVFHAFRPNVVRTAGGISDVLASRPGRRLAASEWAVYAGHDLALGAALRVNAGLRLTAAHTAGTWYVGPEPRLAVRLRLGARAALKASYSRMRQYMHRVSSSSVALPTDLWYPVTDQIRPQTAHQAALGLTWVFPQRGVSLSVEAYVKTIDRILSYREGASLLLNDRFERELLSGSGRARGLEVLLRKRTGRWTGWIGYALARADRQFDGLNGGSRFPARYDRRHTLSVVSMIDLTPRVAFSAVWTYQSGAWFTAQNGQFLMPNASLTTVDLVPVYTARNAVPLAPSHRLDVSFIIRHLFGGEWHIGAYNFYNRAAPFRVAIDHNGVAYQYVQQGLFGFLPFVSYHFSL